LHRQGSLRCKTRVSRCPPRALCRSGRHSFPAQPSSHTEGWRSSQRPWELSEAPPNSRAQKPTAKPTASARSPTRVATWSALRRP
jgi:hypothetical protein